MPRWVKRVVLAASGLAVLAGAGLYYVITSDTTTPVDVADAVGRFREERSAGGSTTTDGGATAGQARPLPTAGVYVYATEGSERVDILGGATHDYPVQTTVTIEHVACGIRQRWEPIEERSDDEELCVTPNGVERRTLRTHHEFFHLDDDQQFECAPGYVVFPTDPQPGRGWPTDCQAGDTRLTGRIEVVGFETLDVASESVETVHVRVEEQAGGSSEGRSSDDYWLRRSDGLLVARESSVETRSGTVVGTATYVERFTLRLVSLAPRT